MSYYAASGKYSDNAERIARVMTLPLLAFPNDANDAFYLCFALDCLQSSDEDVLNAYANRVDDTAFLSLHFSIVAGVGTFAHAPNLPADVESDAKDLMMLFLHNLYSGAGLNNLGRMLEYGVQYLSLTQSAQISYEGGNVGGADSVPGVEVSPIIGLTFAVEAEKLSCSLSDRIKTMVHVNACRFIRETASTVMTQMQRSVPLHLRHTEMRLKDPLDQDEFSFVALSNPKCDNPVVVAAFELKRRDV